MEPDRKVEREERGNSCPELQEFCDMEQLYRLIDNWSKSSGMSAVIVDAYREETGGSDAGNH